MRLWEYIPLAVPAILLVLVLPAWETTVWLTCWTVVFLWVPLGHATLCCVYRVTGDHQGFKINVKWDPATPNDKKLGRTIELWRDQAGREMVPMQLCTPDTEHLTGTEYTGEVHNAWALPQPQKRNRRAPTAQGVIDLLNA